MLSLAYWKEKEIDINGTTYPIDLSYDNVIRVIDLSTDESFEEVDRVIIGMRMLLEVDVLEEDEECDLEMLAESYVSIVQQYIVNDEENNGPVDLKGNPMPVAKNKEIYSLTHDADYIYSSFVQAYGIDLIDAQGELEWDKFNALLKGLPSDTKFKEVIEIRQRPFAKGKGATEENKQLRELKEVYRLPGHSVEEGG